MRVHPLISTLLACVLLTAFLTPAAEAQRGSGHGRGRPLEPAPPGTSRGTGTYSLNGPDVLDAVNRGEGPQVLAYYERAAREFEEHGDSLQAAVAGQLQRAFLYAGTPAVVTTLWKVDDRATYELVRAFYTHLDAADPVGALRQAQIEMQRAFPHPFRWAAFGLTGVAR